MRIIDAVRFKQGAARTRYDPSDVEERKARAGATVLPGGLIPGQVFPELHKGPINTLYMTNHVQSDQPVPFNAVAFIVPQGYVLKLTKVGLIISDPQVAQSAAIGWKVMIGANRLSYVMDTGADAFFFSHGDIGDPLELEPSNVQAGETVAISITITVPEFCMLTGVIQGALVTVSG